MNGLLTGKISLATTAVRRMNVGWIRRSNPPRNGAALPMGSVPAIGDDFAVLPSFGIGGPCALLDILQSFPECYPKNLYRTITPLVFAFPNLITAPVTRRTTLCGDIALPPP
ncbi:MAG: hypothetical protein PHR16_16435 [Methylovulum sp.]|nr:hypothetical protein [Methylovulum sp.]